MTILDDLDIPTHEEEPLPAQIPPQALGRTARIDQLEVRCGPRDDVATINIPSIWAS